LPPLPGGGGARAAASGLASEDENPEQKWRIVTSSVFEERRSQRPGDAAPRLLVIDDEESNLDTFRRVFRRDFQMMFARSVSEGLTLTRQHSFDIAIVDYAMPNEHGIIFLRRAAEIQPDMACLMVTAHADLPDVKQAYAAGLARGIIMKPWDREGILRWVENTRRLASLKRSITDMKSTLERK
jgi:response regulator RpfG family c-di-GMP phosphodiesterase